MKDIQARLVAIELEWAETLDFIKHWAGRQAKRDARAVKQNLGEPEIEHAEGPASGIDGAEQKRALRALVAQRRTGNGFTIGGR